VGARRAVDHVQVRLSRGLERDADRDRAARPARCAVLPARVPLPVLPTLPSSTAALAAAAALAARRLAAGILQAFEPLELLPARAPLRVRVRARIPRQARRAARAPGVQRSACCCG
jgi:hypothetical protein